MAHLACIELHYALLDVKVKEFLMNLNTVLLGTDGPKVSVQGLGCMGMSEFYGDTDQAAALDTLEATREIGLNFLDTADMYGIGANEEFLAPFINKHREDVVIATKFGIQRTATERGPVSNDPAYIRQACDASLKRLNIDVIDVYYMHRRASDVPLADSVGAMSELVAAGKVRYLGLSEVTGAELREADAIHHISAVQSEWSIFSRDVEISTVPAARELGTALVAYSPLGRGFLTGELTNFGANDFRQFHPRFSGDNAKSNFELLDAIRRIAWAHDATLGQIALAWVHQQAQVHNLTVVPIPGTRKRSRLFENAAAAQIVLTQAQLDALEPIAGLVSGPRYADMSGTSLARE